MSIAQIVVQIEEMDEGEYQVRMSYSGGNDLETIETKAAETFAKFLSPNSRNLNTGFRLFLFRISTDSTQILPLIPLGYPIIRHPAAF